MLKLHEYIQLSCLGSLMLDESDIFGGTSFGIIMYIDSEISINNYYLFCFHRELYIKKWFFV